MERVWGKDEESFELVKFTHVWNSLNIRPSERWMPAQTTGRWQRTPEGESCRPRGEGDQLHPNAEVLGMLWSEGAQETPGP